MNWNKILYTICKWIVDISIGLAVIAVLFMIYYIVTGADFTITLNLQEGAISFNQDPDVKVRPEYSNYFTAVTASPNGYAIQVTLGGWLMKLGYGLMIVAVAIYVYLANIFGQLVRSAEAGEFFIRENVKRLRIIGIAFIIMSVSTGIIDWFKLGMMQKYFEVDHLINGASHFSLTPGWFGSMFLFGLFNLILAQAFSHGLGLKEEQELTI
ncbi:DUF2975 domain-containing protein [Roseivirga sp.]|uniref:DUF2975 domain-containing protein n=1 Tax=Roseivirga sp. TaxID=1964215 RepID=UPI003B51ABBE